MSLRNDFGNLCISLVRINEYLLIVDCNIKILSGMSAESNISRKGSFQMEKINNKRKLAFGVSAPCVGRDNGKKIPI